jgi:8-oxo-dGTP pyrophosphatase MutT (NUDIX family)
MLEEILDNILGRFLVDLPSEEVNSPERLFFHVDEAYWFYCDFFCDDDTTLPRHSLKSFAEQLFTQAPWLLPNSWTAGRSYERFMTYKSSIPICGVVVFNTDMSKVLMVQGWGAGRWAFPSGKISRNESEMQCALRELFEETGFDATAFITDERISVHEHTRDITMFIVRGVPETTTFLPRTRKEIGAVAWHDVCALPFLGSPSPGSAIKYSKTLKNVLKNLTRWVHHHPGTFIAFNKKQDGRLKTQYDFPQSPPLPSFETDIIAALEARGLESAQIAAALPQFCEPNNEHLSIQYSADAPLSRRQSQSSSSSSPPCYNGDFAAPVNAAAVANHSKTSQTNTPSSSSTVSPSLSQPSSPTTTSRLIRASLALRSRSPSSPDSTRRQASKCEIASSPLSSPGLSVATSELSKECCLTLPLGLDIATVTHDDVLRGNVEGVMTNHISIHITPSFLQSLSGLKKEMVRKTDNLMKMEHNPLLEFKFRTEELLSCFD